MTLVVAGGEPDWSKGLLPCVVQDAATLQVLVVAWMDEAALAETLVSGEATFHSRSRGGRWRKGETSGHRLRGGVADAPTATATRCCWQPSRWARPATSAPRRVSVPRTPPASGRLARLEATIAERAGADPATSYTARLLAEGVKRAAQKVGEEGVETALAGAAGDAAELAGEAADLLFHLLVLLSARDVRLGDVLEVLARRAG